MTSHTATVRREELDALLVRIRRSGGIVTEFRRDGDGVRVTWTDRAVAQPA